MSIRSKILLFAAFFIAFFSIEAALFQFQQQRITGVIGAHLVELDSDVALDISGHLKSLEVEGNIRLLFIYFVTLLGGGAAAYILFRQLVPPLKNAIAITNNIRFGYFQNDLKITSHDEVGELLAAIGELQETQQLMRGHLERAVSETEAAYLKLEENAAALTIANTSLGSLNASMNTMLDALEQGLFMFGADGTCSDVSSKACLDLFEGNPAELPVTQLLRLTEEESDTFMRLLKLVFSGSNLASDASDLMALFPSTFVKSDGTRITLAYHAIMDSDNNVRLILCVATDHTAEEAALRLLRDRENEALSVLRISANRNLFTQFYRGITDFFATTDNMDSLDMLRRDIHTFKGNASIFHLQDVVDVLHAMEHRLSMVAHLDEAKQEIKIEIPKLQAALTKAHKQAYDLLGRDFDQHGITRTLPLKTLAAVSNHIRKTGNAALYRTFVENLMGEPIRQTLSTFDIGLHELADRFGKEIGPCYFSGENFPLLIENYQELFATLPHIARNIISHAIDPPDVREDRGKDAQLTVIIGTRKYKVGEQEWFQMSFEDDGCGLNVALLREKIAAATSKEQAAAMAEREVMRWIFRDNFSTQENASELSGRGVGLSAVKAEAEKLGGRADVESECGVFTKITVDVPLSWVLIESRVA